MNYRMLGSQFLAALKLNKMKKQVPNSNELKGLKIAINTVRPLEANFCAEGYLGLLFALHGAKVRIYLDDGILYHWDKIQVDDHDEFLNPKARFDFKAFLLEKAFKLGLNHSNLEFINYSQLGLNEKIRNEYMNEVSRNLKIEINGSKKVKLDFLVKWIQDTALSSVIRYFKTEALNFEDENVLKYFKMSIVNAILSWKVAVKINDTFHPSIYITNHGIYSTFSPAVRYFKNAHVKTLILGGLKVHGTDYSKWSFSDVPIQQLSTSQYWKEWSAKHHQLTDEQENKVYEWLRKRKNLLSCDHQWLTCMKDKIYHLDNKKSQFKHVVGIFPNVIWDGNISERWGEFNGLLDWLDFTLNHLKNRKDVLMVLKPHPTELTFCKKGKRTLDFLKNRVNFKIFNNLIIILPEWKINTYELIPKLDLGIVWDGVLALEMPLMGVPSITIAKNGLFTIPGTIMMDGKKKMYASCLNNLDLVIKRFKIHEKEHLMDILKYAYWFLNVEGISLPTYSRNVNGGYKRSLRMLEKKHFQLTSRMKQFLM